jgi:hypothetical protein
MRLYYASFANVTFKKSDFKYTYFKSKLHTEFDQFATVYDRSWFNNLEGFGVPT